MIYEMMLHQMPLWFIADRTGLSERHIRRIVKSWDARIRPRRRRRQVQSHAAVIRAGREYDLWRYYRDCGYSYDRLSWVFGRSKQAIQQSLQTRHHGAA